MRRAWRFRRALAGPRLAPDHGPLRSAPRRDQAPGRCEALCALQEAVYRHLYNERHGVWLQLIVLVIGKVDGLLGHYRPSEEQMEAAWETFTHLLAFHALKPTVAGSVMPTHAGPTSR